MTFDPRDTRTQREKLEAMARQKESPNEAKVARHLLFKKYGRGGHHETPQRDRSAYEEQQRSRYTQAGHDEFMGFMRSKRTHKTQSDVLDAFLRGELGQSRAAHVPGGRRQSIHPSTEDDFDLGTDLFSYQTTMARRHRNDEISLNPRRYSTTTSKMMGRLRTKLSQLGYEPTGEQRKVSGVRNMGRWGGFGLPWAERNADDIMFDVWRKPKKPAEKKLIG